MQNYQDKNLKERVEMIAQSQTNGKLVAIETDYDDRYPLPAISELPGVRAGLCHDVYSAHQGVEHDDVNVLCLGGRVVGPALTYDILRSWLTARYIGTGRHKRRVDQILEIERNETERKEAS